MRPEVRMARYVEALERYRGGRLSCMEAAEFLGISERHSRRLRERYEADGAEGLIDRRGGRASGRRAPVDRIEFVVEQYRTRYWDFTVKHFHEALQAEHGFALGYTWTKTVLQSRGLVARSTRGRRPRSDGPWPSSGSSTSRPTARKPAVAWNGYSGPCNSACHHCCGSTASPRLRRPTDISPILISASTTPALRWPRPRKAAPLCRSRPACGTSCAASTSVWSGVTIACAMTGGSYKSPSSGTAITSSR